MGWFDKTKKITTNVVNTTTTTNTRIRDIGLTGANALNIVQAIEAGGVAREQLALNTVTNIGDVAVSSFDRAADVFVDAFDISAQSFDAAAQNNRDVALGQQDVAFAQIDLVGDIQESNVTTFQSLIDGLTQGFQDLVTVGETTIIGAQEVAGSAQQSALELQRQATGAEGPSLTTDPDKTSLAIQIGIVVIGVVLLGVFRK